MEFKELNKEAQAYAILQRIKKWLVEDQYNEIERKKLLKWIRSKGKNDLVAEELQDESECGEYSFNARGEIKECN